MWRTAYNISFPILHRQLQVFVHCMLRKQTESWFLKASAYTTEMGHCSTCSTPSQPFHISPLLSCAHDRNNAQISILMWKEFSRYVFFVDEIFEVCKSSLCKSTRHARFDASTFMSFGDGSTQTCVWFSQCCRGFNEQVYPADHEPLICWFNLNNHERQWRRTQLLSNGFWTVPFWIKGNWEHVSRLVKIHGQWDESQKRQTRVDIIRCSHHLAAHG